MRFRFATIVLTLCLSTVMAEIEIKIPQYDSITNLRSGWIHNNSSGSSVYFRCRIESTNETCDFIPSHLYCNERNGCKGSVPPRMQLKSVNITTVFFHGMLMREILERYPDLNHIYGLRVHEIDYVLEFNDQHIECSNEQTEWENYFRWLLIGRYIAIGSVTLFFLVSSRFLLSPIVSTIMSIISMPLYLLLADSIISIPVCASTGPMYLR